MKTRQDAIKLEENFQRLKTQSLNPSFRTTGSHGEGIVVQLVKDQMASENDCTSLDIVAARKSTRSNRNSDIVANAIEDNLSDEKCGEDVQNMICSECNLLV